MFLFASLHYDLKQHSNLSSYIWYASEFRDLGSLAASIEAGGSVGAVSGGGLHVSNCFEWMREHCQMASRLSQPCSQFFSSSSLELFHSALFKILHISTQRITDISCESTANPFCFTQYINGPQVHWPEAKSVSDCISEKKVLVLTAFKRALLHVANLICIKKVRYR